MHANRAGAHVFLLVEETKHVGDIFHHRRDGHFGANGAHAVAFWVAHRQHAGAEFGIAARAVIKIGQHNVIAGGGQPPRHVVQFLTNAGCIHQHQHGGERAVTFGMADKAFHRAGAGLDINDVFDHGVCSFNPP